MSTSNVTQTIELKKRAWGGSSATSTPGYLARRSVWDWLFAAFVVAGAVWGYLVYGPAMSIYETYILIGCVPSLIWVGWYWRPVQTVSVLTAAFTLLAIWLYQTPTGPDLNRSIEVFWLKYFISSQSAILWMCLLLFMSTIFYWIGMFTRASYSFLQMGSRLAWAGILMGLIGSFVRWYESHQMGPGMGHFPFSNLYEVFVLFCWLTTMMYLYYEEQHKNRAMGAFAMLVVSAAVGFLLWYTVVREAHEIQPLVPALKSWWMTLHVPTNFIGYGGFAIAGMLAFAYLVKQSAGEMRWYKLAPLWLLGVTLFLEPLVFSRAVHSQSFVFWLLYFGVASFIVGGIMLGRRRIAARLPSFEVLDDIMYKAIAIGFAFFLVATVLGAFWAAEAWGGYWTWDPKETWSLIVILNYAAWLHMRLVKGLRGTVAAWWAMVGLAITTFCFLGVNMFLSGLHSYGAL
ncbi:c-type cytochrome biogenesis protein CcsB [Hydrogenophaga sp.]|uniref:c-type cytochrome biogenesis protein CcsB n=1 Tax=Hydrogenophaga sp. TaxID=1904254 RepID=UPI0019A6F6DF|nr:c-type cytochrome biogenesis protein CcsB [Hydrogenophaga sp.]MBD3893283.1 c-type cytochrome biogenesis protein CcsB [Hydrogenophaga sp.]